MNNHQDLSVNEPVECSECHSSMTEHLNNVLECDECSHLEFKDDSNDY
jgi:hypothetical protein